MNKTSKNISPGTYRTCLAPAAVADLISMFSWGGISESSLQQKDSALLKMREDSKNLSPCFTLKEDFTTEKIIGTILIVAGVFILNYKDYLQN